MFRQFSKITDHGRWSKGRLLAPHVSEVFGMFGFSSAAWADTIARSPQRTVRRMCYAGAETAAQKNAAARSWGVFIFIVVLLFWLIIFKRRRGVG
jgi:hypothetical protein